MPQPSLSTLRVWTTVMSGTVTVPVRVTVPSADGVGPPADRVGSSLQAAKVAAARRNIAAKRRFIRFSMFYIYLSAFTSRTQRTAGSFGEVE